MILDRSYRVAHVIGALLKIGIVFTLLKAGFIVKYTQKHGRESVVTKAST